MSVHRIATIKAGKGKPAVLIEFNTGKPVEISHADLTTHDTTAKLLAEAERQSERTLADFYFHINRDGSIAVATGEEPPVWPEDI